MGPLPVQMPFMRVTTPISTGRCSPCMFTYHHSVFEDTALISNKGAPGTTTPWNSSDVNSQVFSEVDSLVLRWTSGCSKVLYGSISCNFMASFYIHAAKRMIRLGTCLLLWPTITAIWKTMRLHLQSHTTSSFYVLLPSF